MLKSCPRLVLAGLRGGSGKTALSLGLTAAWRRAGRTVVPFKKGPDYIDAGWLAFAAGRPCFNLDPFLMGWEQVSRSFLTRSSPRGVAVIEGNRGLFDGMDVEGSYSTAELAKLLAAPVVLILDCTKATRTVASLVLGCQRFDETLNLAGVVLNRLAGSRHESTVRAAIERYCGLRVLGALPKFSGGELAERHMGLVPSHEVPGAEAVLGFAAECAQKFLDLEALWEVAQAAPPLEGEPLQPLLRRLGFRPRVGVIRDSAFWFYYPENIEALAEAGAEVLYLDALSGDLPSGVDGLYIGGGFPESFAAQLAANGSFREALRLAIEEGLPVYAECGGLMYLGRALHLRGDSYPMVGALPVSFTLERKPQGHGYTVLEAEEPNPYYEPGLVIHGHEFRYSRVQGWEDGRLPLAFRVERGHGFDGRRDGLVYKGVLASYTHVHALGVRQWAVSLVDRAAEFRMRRGAGLSAVDAI
jgi:cobyrinic acid a,c-diamide synthase